MTDLFDSPRRMHRVRFEPQGVEVEAPDGRVLMAAARQAGIHIEAPCGGQGWCGRCRVHVTGELSPHTPDEQRLLRPDELADSIRLACRARIQGDVVVHMADERAGMRIVEAGEEPRLEVEPPEERGIGCGERCFGAAVDVGTTTLAAVLVDLRTGKRVDSASAVNPQARFGADVLSRVSYALAGGLGELHVLVVAEVERMLLGMLAAAGVPAEELVEIAVAGNTAMAHLFFGIDPTPISAAPYEGARLAPVRALAAEVGFARLPAAHVYALPAISAFVGGDIVGGLMATALRDQDEAALLIDLGTNGELVLRTGDGELLACSTAAGPALEGASISQGMRAEAGAIERVSREGHALALSVIGETKPHGICGSGLLDLAEVLLESGAMDAIGRLQPAGPIAALVGDAEGIRRVRLADDVFVTQHDIRQLQLAKGAVAAGISLLLEEAALPEESVGDVIVAGGFGAHVRPTALARIGLVPRAWADRVSFAGNTSLEGATLALTNSRCRSEAERLATSVRTLDLAAHPAFERRFLGALDFPAE